MEYTSNDLIGIVACDRIEVVAAKVGPALTLTLLPRESSYWGDPYYSAWPESDVKLTANFDPMFAEGDPAEDHWFMSAACDVPYLLWDADDPSAAIAALSEAGLDVRLIRRHS